MSFLFCLIILITKPILTISENCTVSSKTIQDIYDASGVTLPSNGSLWNVTLVYLTINATAPQILTLQNPTISFPPCIIKQLPYSYLAFWSLCEYIPNNITSINCTSNATQPPIPKGYFCQGPLVLSKYKNPISDKGIINGNIDVSLCGLNCDMKDIIYGLTKNDQKIIDIIKYIGLTISFIIVVLLSINLCCDGNQSKKSVKNSLLAQIPYFITFWCILLIVCMTVGTIVGIEKVSCTDNAYSYDNYTHGKNARCTIYGSVFYASILGYAFYSFTLSFAIFRQFYQPLNPFCGLKPYVFHLIIWGLILISILFAVFTGSINPVPPMGVCLPGAGDKKKLLGFMCIPTTLSEIFSIIFGFGSWYFVKKNIGKNKATTDTAKMQDLLNRLSMYSIGVTICLTIVNVAAWYFVSILDELKLSLQNHVGCELERIFYPLNPVCQMSIRVNPYWFYSWIIACAMAALAQLILTCHENARARMKRAATVMNAVGNSIRESTRTKSNNEGSKLSKHERVLSNELEANEKETKQQQQQQHNTNDTQTLELQTMSQPESPEEVNQNTELAKVQSNSSISSPLSTTQMINKQE